MKHLKVTSALLAAAMGISMGMTPVSVLADETEVPSETQSTEAAQEEEAEESGEQESEAVEDKALEGETSNKVLDAYLAKGKCGKKVKWTLDKKGTLKITGKKAMYNYTFILKTINANINDPELPLQKVPATNAPWEKYSSKIKKVVVSKGVTTIGDMAFALCPNLTSVSLPKTLKSIGVGAFAYCPNLTKISIPKKVKTIGTGAFSYTGIVNMAIPKGVTSISNNTFEGCKSLKSVSIPSSVKSIGNNSFASCISLTSVSIPASVTSIGQHAFAYCSNLVTVKIPVSGLNSIANYAFYKCSKLSGFEVPLTVKTIGDYAFAECTELCRVWINEKQKADLPSHAFEGCSYVTFDENKHLLNGDSFNVGPITYRVSNPAINGTGTVDVYSFNPDVEKLVIPSTVEYSDDHGFVKVKYKVTVIKGDLSQYNVNSKLKALVIGSNVSVIMDNAFTGCPELESVTGGAGVKSIGAKAFAKCLKLKVFNISSKTLSKIGAYAFSGDTALTTLQIKKTMKLTKAGVKNSLKESSVKTVKVKKSKVKKYKKIFKKKNCGKKVKVKK